MRVASMPHVGLAMAAFAWLSGAGELGAHAQETAVAAEEAAGGRMPELRLSRRSLAMLDKELVAEEADQAGEALSIEAGEIPRAALRAELERGIGAFLRHVRAKPAIVRGRFAGWRVVELFKRRPEIHVVALRPGDTVLKVNGRSVERPEQLKYVWDKLGDAQELVIEIERDAQRRKLRYTISDSAARDKGDARARSRASGRARDRQ